MTLCQTVKLVVCYRQMRGLKLDRIQMILIVGFVVLLWPFKEILGYFLKSYLLPFLPHPSRFDIHRHPII